MLRRALAMAVLLTAVCCYMLLERTTSAADQGLIPVSDREASQLFGGQSDTCKEYLATIVCPPSAKKCNGMDTFCPVYVRLDTGKGTSAKNLKEYRATQACSYTCSVCGSQCGCFAHYHTYDPCAQ